MNHNTLPSAAASEIQPFSTERRELLYKKIRLASAATTERFGNPHPTVRADVLYDVLFHADEAAARHEIDVAKYSDREEIIGSRLLPADTEIEVGREEFVTFVAGLIDDPAINRESMFPGALETLEALAARGPVTIWTQGDMYGLPASEHSAGIGGRAEQMKKIAGGGVGALRRRMAKAAFGEINPSRLREVMDVEASEDKFKPEVIERLIQRLGDDDAVVLLEDRLRNLRRLRDELIKRGVDGERIWAVWVQQGIRGKAGSPSEDEDIVLLDSIDGVPALLDRIDGRIGSVVDFDDVLSDQTKRLGLITASVERFLLDHMQTIRKVREA